MKSSEFITSNNLNFWYVSLINNKKEKGGRILKNFNNDKGHKMSKNISLVLSIFLFAACSTSNIEIKKEESVEKAKKEVVVNENIENKKDSKSSDEVNIKKQQEIKNLEKVDIEENKKKNNVEKKKNSLGGTWVANSSGKFLQRTIYLEQVNEDYAKGYLEMAYENSNNEIKVIDKFDLEVYFHMYSIEGYVTDKKTNKEEIVDIYRDSEDEFRVIANPATVFFDDEPMVFKKPSLNNKFDDVEEIEGVEYFKKDKNVVLDSKNSLIWRDSPSNRIIKSNFNKAVLYCKGIDENYRLPSREELKSTYDKTTSSINKAFEYKKDSCYWSGDYSIGDVTKAWCFDYGLGHERLINKDEKVNIRCVKDKK